MAASVIFATTAVETPMGAQAYEEAVVARAPAALEALRPGATFARSVSRSLRSPLPGTVRLPMGLLRTAGPSVRRTLGALAYPRGSLVHRMDLILPPPAGPDVVTLHDVVAWTFPDEEPPASNAPTELRAADAVVCVSQFTADQAAEMLGLRNTVVVHNGVDQRYFDPAPLDTARRSELGLPERYVLYAGGSAARKNLPALAAAWRAVAPSLPDWGIALAGPPSPARLELFAGAPRVTHLGRLPDGIMPGLVAGAAMVVVPSTYEGFGLPALEAMAAGVPLVSSNRSSLPEVVDGCGLLVDPTRDGLADGILAVAQGGSDIAAMVARATLRSREFTWERSAAGHAAVWSQLL